MICDGIGSLPEGEQASSYVVRQLANWFMEKGYQERGKKQQRLLQQLCFQLHEELKAYGKERGIRLGTTMTCVLMDDKEMVLFHCGDCRLYLLGKRRVRCLTKEQHNEKGNLTCAIGVGKWRQLQVRNRRVKKGERFLLCTDGLYRSLEEKALKDWSKKEIRCDGQAERMLRLLFERCILKGEKDNISGIYFGETEAEKKP